jgi:helicase
MRKLRGVDEKDARARVVRDHLLKDIAGNLNAFAGQEFRCTQCLPPNMIISGDCKPINEYNERERCLGSRGLTTITKKFERYYDGDMVSIKAMGTLPVEITPDHPLLVFSRKIKGLDTNGKYITNFTSQWKPAKEVNKAQKNKRKGKTEGDYLAMPILKGDISDAHISLTPFLKQGSKYVKYPLNKYKKVLLLGKTHLTYANISQLVRVGRCTVSKWIRGKSRPSKGNPPPQWLPLNNSMAWLLGVYVAEGSTSKSGARFSFGKHEHNLIQKTCNTIKRLGFSPVVYSGKTTTVVQLSSRVVARAFISFCGRGAHEKRIPLFILYHKQKDIIKCFLKGYLAGDGCTLHNEKICVTASRVLALQLQLLLARLGMLGCLSEVAVKETYIGTHQIKGGIYYRVGFTPKSPRKKYCVINNFVLVPIRAVSKKHYHGTVYNFQTNNENYLVHNLVVHNCGKKVRRIPVGGKCPECGRNLIQTVYFGGVIKYLELLKSVVQDIGDNLLVEEERVLRSQVEAYFRGAEPEEVVAEPKLKQMKLVPEEEERGGNEATEEEKGD